MTERRWIQAPEFSCVGVMSQATGLRAVRVNEAAEQDPDSPDYLGRRVACMFPAPSDATQTDLDAEAEILLERYCRARWFIETDGQRREVGPGWRG